MEKLSEKLLQKTVGQVEELMTRMAKEVLDQPIVVKATVSEKKEQQALTFILRETVKLKIFSEVKADPLRAFFRSPCAFTHCNASPPMITFLFSF